MHEKTDPIYAEFADTDLSKWPYVTSEMARAEIRKIAATFKLGFVYNPGGGEFSNEYGFRCHITTYDDVADLKTLRAAISQIATISRVASP
jgi:hypothetical protein